MGSIRGFKNLNMDLKNLPSHIHLNQTPSQINDTEIGQNLVP